MGPRDDLSASACASRKGESFKVTEQQKPAESKGASPCPTGQPAHKGHGQEPHWDHDCMRQVNVYYPEVSLEDKTAGK